jgi:hypothetical protein
VGPPGVWCVPGYFRIERSIEETAAARADLGPAAAVTTPSRIAQAFDKDDVLWRQLPSGEIEVATLVDGAVERHLVHPDGSTTLVGTSPPPPRSGWAVLVAIGALLIGGSIAQTALSGTDEGAARTAVFLVGLAALFTGLYRRGKGKDLRVRVRREHHDSEWHAPTNLHGWTPRTSEQLAAVEHVAEENGGLAFVCGDDAREVEVYAVRKGRLRRFRVDEDGQAVLVDASGPPVRYRIDQAVQWAGVGVIIGFVVARPLRHDTELALALVGTGVALILLSTALGNSLALERRVRRLPGPGYPWIEIRTRVSDPD